MTKNTETWAISFPEGKDKVAVHSDVQATAQTTDQAITDSATAITEDVMGQVDTEITEAMDHVVHYGDPEAGRQREEDDIAYSVTFQDGRRTWLESDTRGYPTSWSRTVLIDTLEPYWGGDGGDGGGGVTTRAATPVTGDNLSLDTRHTPRLSYPIDEPVVPYENLGTASVLSPFLVQTPSQGIKMVYSTDHGTHGQSGLWMMDVGNPLDPGSYTNPRMVWRDDSGGGQMETPEWWFAPGANKIRMAYQLQNSTINGGIPEQPPKWQSQLTLMAECDPDDVETWTRVGPITMSYGHRFAAGNHTGYFRTFWWAGGLYAYSMGAIFSGGGGTRNLWQSHDEGATWNRLPDAIGNPVLTDHLPFVHGGTSDAGTGVTAGAGHAMEWKGALWFLTTAGTSTGGGAYGGGRRILVYQSRPDLLGPAFPAADITPELPAWSTDGFASIEKPIVVDGRMYALFTIADENNQKDIGIMEIT